MRFIGITGGIGAGKSEILSYIRQHYLCEIYLADEVAHLVRASGSTCFQQLVALLGEAVIGADGEIDKAAMAARIFMDKQLLAEVNEIVHPAVRQFILDRRQEAAQKGNVELFFVEAALLIEAGYGELVDEMWYIYTEEKVRRERLRQSRGYSDEKITSILRNQLDESAYRRHCDFVIDNNGSLQDCFKQIDKKLEAYQWRE